MNEIIKAIDEKLTQQKERIELLEWQKENLTRQIKELESEIERLRGA